MIFCFLLSSSWFGTSNQKLAEYLLLIIKNVFKILIFLITGCFCVYSDGPSFEYIRESLEKELFSNLEQEDRLPFQVTNKRITNNVCDEQMVIIFQKAFLNAKPFIKSHF